MSAPLVIGRVMINFPGSIGIVFDPFVPSMDATRLEPESEIVAVSFSPRTSNRSTDASETLSRFASTTA